MSLKSLGEGGSITTPQAPSALGLAPPISLQGIVNLAQISTPPASCMTFHLDEGSGLQASPPLLRPLRFSSSPPTLPHPLYLTIPSLIHLQTHLRKDS